MTSQDLLDFVDDASPSSTGILTERRQPPIVLVDCSKLGAAELAYRQALRNLERCVTWEGIIPRKRRKSFEQFLDHKDPRIRARAREMLEEDRVERAYQRSMRELDETLSEEELSGIECNEGIEEGNGASGEPDDRPWSEIPF